MRTALTTPHVIEAMAERYHLPIELTSNAAYLSVGDVTWYAPLPPPGWSAEDWRNADLNRQARDHAAVERVQQ